MLIAAAEAIARISEPITGTRASSPCAGAERGGTAAAAAARMPAGVAAGSSVGALELQRPEKSCEAIVSIWLSRGYQTCQSCPPR